MKYDLFISYSRKDFDEVSSILEIIKTAIPNLSYWFDIDGIESGDEFEDKIISAIDNSSYVLFALSENSISSVWTKDEVMYAKNTDKKVIPILLKGAEMKGWFLFKFGRIDCIDSTNSLQMEKLIQNLSAWTGKEYVGDSQPTANEEPVVMCPCGSGKLFKDCHGRTVAPTPKPVENAWKVGDYYTHGEEEGIVFWVDETGRYGKVVSVDEQMLPWCTEEEYESGLSLISFSDSNGMLNLQSIMQIPDWRNKYPAFAWCADHGENWYLPAIDELKELLLNDDVREKINGMLEQKGKSTMCRQPVWDSIVLNEPFDGGVDGYWSSTINGRWQAHIVDTLFFRMGESQRTFCFAVRAVSTFDERWLLSFEI